MIRKQKTNFISYKENDEKSMMHPKSDKLEIMIANNSDEVTEESVA